MPCGPRKRSSSSMRVRMRRSLSSLTSDRMWRPCLPGLSGSAMRAMRSPLRRKWSSTAGRSDGNLPRTLRLEHGRRAQGEQADERADLQALPGAVGEAEDVVEEAVLLVPHLVGVVADRIHRGGDPEEPHEELHDEVLVGRVALGEGERQLQHVLAVQRHPRRAVGLLEAAAGGQGRAAVEHADVVEAEEAALEHAAAARVLAVDPPGEVEQQLVERLAQERQVDVVVAARLLVEVMDEHAWRRRAPAG